MWLIMFLHPGEFYCGTIDPNVSVSQFATKEEGLL